MMKKLFIVVLGLSLLGCKKKSTVSSDSLPTTVSTFRESGLDVSWDQSGSDLIAYSAKGTDGYYDIHYSLPDGSGDVCLTCDHPLLPNKHICCPFWHPSGQWLIFLAEKATHPGSSTDALPGFGAYSDIWVMSKDGSKAYKLVDIVNDYDHGVIAPRFSPDGKRISWTDRKTQPNALSLKQTFGYWTIKTADFSFDANNVPQLSNIRTFEPGPDSFYECYGFSPDGNRLIFCSSMNKPSVLDQQIYTMDTNGNNLTQLTSKDYNEHGFYTPDGSKIIWMSNTKSTKGGTDWWRMSTDGSGKERLTFFNEPDYPQCDGNARWAGLGSFRPDGKKFVGGVQLSLVTQEGKIMMVELK
ncbi:MAG: TolB family protein [Bacteroidia bacterium]